MSTINNIVVDSSTPYLNGRRIGSEVDQKNYKRLLQLQQLARENGYADKDAYEQVSAEQVLFILGVVQEFRLQYQKASGNWLDLEVEQEHQ